MEEVILLVEPAEDGGYNTKTLTHAIFTQAETLKELRINIRDAVDCHFEAGE